MKAFYWLSILAMVIFALSCGSSDDDDDDDNDAADDDFLDDDDDDATDDDAVSETWTDEATGLVWQVDPPQEVMTWENAIAYCEGLNLADFTDWRMPTISELRSIVRGCPDTFIGGECGVTDECAVEDECRNDACSGCEEMQGQNDGQYLPIELNPVFGNDGTFSSTMKIDEYNDAAWSVCFDNAVAFANSVLDGFVRCVR